MKVGCSVSSGTRRWVLLATMLASGAAFLLGSAVSVALPAIQTHFNTSLTSLQWVVNAQLLTLAALLLVGGSMGDRFGRKRIFITGMGIFLIGTALSGVANSIGLLIALQAIIGLGSAMMVPQSLAIINACFAEEERGRAIGLWAGLSGGISALGPWVGGWLVETFSWRAVFFMVVPVILLTLLITSIFVPESRNPNARRLDWWGTLLIFAGLLGAAYGLITAPIAGWTDAAVLIALVGGALAIATFALVETRQPEPLVPLHIFRSPLVLGANLVTLFLYFALNGVIFFLVLNFQQVQEFSPTEAGLGLLPTILLITFLSIPAGTLTDRIGPRWPMIIGPAVVAVGMGLIILPGTGADYWMGFFPGLVLFGLGMALVIPALTKSALAVPEELSGAASGVNNAVSRVAALLAVAVLGVVMLTSFNTQLKISLSTSSLTQDQKIQIISQSDKLGGTTIPETFDASSRSTAQTVVQDSFVHGFRWVMGVNATLAFIGAVISFITIRSRQKH